MQLVRCAACGGQYNWMELEPSLGQREPQRGEGLSGPRPAAGSVRESCVRTQAFGEPADGRRQLCGYAFRGSSGSEQIEDCG